MKLVIFDFDGVLAHTHLMCFEIHRELNPDLDYKFFQSLSSGNFIAGYAQAEKENKIKSNPNFMARYQDRIASLDMPLELKEAVLSLEQDHILAIVSSTSTAYIEPYLRKENILDKFQRILGRDEHVSKTAKIKMLLAEHDLSSRDAVFITDTTGDIIEAREAGVATIAVLWGLHDKEDLLAENPLALVANPVELEQKIREYLC